METAVISQQTANSLPTGLNADQQRASFTPGNYAIGIPAANEKNTFIKSTAGFAVNALEKALKLNLLGADINTEYLELTARVYARAAIIYAKHYLRQFATKTLSHKNILADMFRKLPGHYAFKNLAQ